MSPEQMNNYFRDKPMPPRFITYKELNHQMFYATTGSDTNQLILFVHGAPGSWDAFIKYLGDTVLMNHAQLVSVDRPGYGKSGLGQSVASIEDQARMIQPILDANKSNKPAIIIGHSLGGAVIARIAMDYPDKVGELIFLAPAIDPDHEKIWKISYPANWKIFKWMVPPVWKVTNDEKLSHSAELKKMLPLWSDIHCHCVYMYGAKDAIVPPENVEFAKRMLVNAPLEIIAFPHENHFIPWTKKDSIIKVILNCLRK
ncbi:MAG: alpha/beta hydrolase [Chitinophagales bacterium]|nr:alpha/beta hydrolase [Chitinophagales bacterium]